MASSVDDKIVSMKFDNKAFEANVESTMSLLDKLKEKLKFDGAGKGLENVSNATKGFSLDNIGSAVDSISNKFSAMGVVSFSVLNSLVDRAITAGAAITKSLGLGTIIDGFHEYETAIESTQTILANTKSKGTTLDDVNATLAQLNEYSDKTIYNFGQMTSSLGRFTAAGVDLKTSAESIKGISNLAALSGAKPEEQARAMYQLSQAIASGTLRLEDWNSVEAANIGGETFKNSLFETAKALGTLPDVPLSQTFQEWQDAGNNFRLSLQDGWITTDVLTQSLSTFTGELSQAQLESLGYTTEQAKAFAEVGKTALESAVVVKTWTGLIGTLKEAVGSGFSESYKQIFGDFEQAKTFFTGLNTIFSGIIGNVSKARNDRLQTLNELGGREAIIQSLRNVLFSVALVLSTIGKAFRDAFPRKTATELLVITKSIESFTRKLIPSEKTLNAIGAAFHIVFSILSIGWEIIKAVFGAFSDLFGVLGDFTGGGRSSVIGFFTSIGDAANSLKKALVDDGGIKNFFAKFITPIIDFVKQIDISEHIQKIVDGFNKVKAALTSFADQHDLAEKFDQIKNKVLELKETFLGFFDQSDNLNKASDIAGAATGRLSDRWESFIKIGEKLGKYFDWIEEKLTWVKDRIVEAFDKIREAFSSGEFNPDGDVLNFGFLAAGFLAILTLLKNAKAVVGGFWAPVKDIIESFTGVMKAMQTELKAEALMKIAIAVGILTASMVVLSLIDTNALTKAFTAMAGGIAALVASMVILSSISSGIRGAASLDLIALGLILMAAAVLVLSVALKSLADINPDRLEVALSSLAAILLGLIGFVASMPSETDMVSIGIGIFAVAAGLKKMAKVVVQFSEMDPAKLAQGIAALVIVMGTLVGTMRLMSGDLGKPTGMIILGAALWIIFKVVESFANMELDKMIQGLIGLVGIMAAIALTMNTMPPDLPLIAAGLVIVALALEIMVDAISKLAVLDIVGLIAGVGGLAIMLAVIAIAANAMTGAIVGALAIFVVAASLKILADAIEVLANVGFGSVLLAILGLAIALAVIAAAAIVLTPVVPFIALLGASLIILGAGLTLVGLGALLFGAGLALAALAIGLFVKAGGDGIDIIIAIIPKLLTALTDAVLRFIQTIIGAIPDIVSGLGEIISAIMQTLTDLLPQFATLVTTIIQTILQIVTDNAPAVWTTGRDLIFFLLDGVKENIAHITEIVLDIIFAFVNTLIEHMPEIVDAGVNLLSSFLNALADRIQLVIDAGGNLIVSIIRGIGEKSGDIVNAAVDTVIKFSDELRNQIWRIVDAAWEFVIGVINGVTDSINTHSDELREAGVQLIQAIIDGMTGGLLSKGQEAIDGLKSLGSDMIDGFKGMLGIQSPSKVMFNLAGYIAQGLANGLASDTSAANSATAFGTDVKNKLASALSNAAMAMDNMDAFNPTIAPVLDLSNIEQGANKMSKLMETPTIDTSYGFNQAAAISLADKEQRAVLVDDSNSTPQTRDVTLSQTFHSPTELNESDIYRKTKALLAMAKEELTRENN